jgi:hypothetical protein
MAAEMKNAAQGGIFATRSDERLDSDAELAGLLSSAGVKVVWGAVVELVAQTEFAAYIDAEGGNGHSNGEPTEHAESVALFGFFKRRKWKSFSRHGWMNS